MGSAARALPRAGEVPFVSVRAVPPLGSPSVGVRIELFLEKARDFHGAVLPPPAGVPAGGPLALCGAAASVPVPWPRDTRKQSHLLPVGTALWGARSFGVPALASPVSVKWFSCAAAG